MFKQFLDKVTGADIWMVSSMVVFMAFFVGVSIYLMSADKKHIDEMKNMPLDTHRQ